MKNRTWAGTNFCIRRLWPLQLFRSILLVIGIGCALIAVAEQDEASELGFSDQQIEFFESRIRPILVERCFECHSSEADFVEGGLYLDSRSSILAGGDSGPAIELDDVAGSILLDAINYGKLFEMPPSSKLPQSEIDLLTQWVEMGAPWPKESEESVGNGTAFDLESLKGEHWCWHPPQPIERPQVTNQTWPKNSIDHFILQKLESEHLQPNAAAERDVLIRRAYFDLIGLPPTPDQVHAFLDDVDPHAFSTVIDQLLESPHFGERWARHWMDLIRYAETYGHEFDYPIDNAFHYRDYLIRTFNADVPYDQFIREHVAGDLLDEPRLNPEDFTNESILGTGFWFLGEATHGPVDVKGDEAGRIDNQIDILSKTFLGLTVACARCHDHKFDAISIRDYYAISGFLQSSRRQDVLLDPHKKIEAQFSQISKLVEQGDEQALSAMENLKQTERRQLVNHLAGTIEAIAMNPSLLNVDVVQVEAETMTTVRRDGGNVIVQELSPQDGTHWSGNRHLWWFEGKQGDEFVVEFEIPFAATFDVFADFTKAVDYGIAKVTLNDHVLAEALDLYAPTLGKSGEMPLGAVQLAAGKQRLTVKSVGTHPDSVPKYMFGLDYLKFVPIGLDRVAGDEREQLNGIATRYEIELDSLRKWIKGLTDAETAQPSHPLFAIRQLALALSRDGKMDLSFAQQATRQAIQQQWDAAETFREQAVLFADFSESNYGAWFETGFAFGGGSTESISAETAGDQIVMPKGLAHSGRYGKRMYGVLRSPTFEIQHPRIHYRMLADDARIRLIIDGFVLDVHNPLLFNGMTFRHSSDGKFGWRTQADDLKNYIGHRAHIEIIDHGDGFAAVDEIWFSDSVAPVDYPSEVARSVLAHDAASISEYCQQFVDVAMQDRSNNSLDQVKLLNWIAKYEVATGELTDSIQRLVEVKQQIAQVQSDILRPRIAIGMTDGTPEDEFVFIRGNHRNLGEPVPRDIIWALKREPDELFDIDRGSGRLYLADQIASAENPLTARVVVNRLWHHLMGRGIVESVDNFGVLGEEPTHPELLDYLAQEFCEDGWSIKRMIKRIMLSQTYQMASTLNQENENADPMNRLYHRAPVRRLQGEAIRDAMLHVSGDLDPKMFGPSVPIHLTPFMQGRGRPGNSGPLNGFGRRSVYIEVRRNFLPPMMLAFDTPIPFNAIGRRTESNVPAQALILMNSPFVVEQARKWAERLIETEPDVETRISRIYRQAFARLPSAEELDQAVQFLTAQASDANLELDDQMANNVELWADYCHVMFNVKEFIFLR